MTTEEIASRIVVLAVVAFCLWLIFLSMFRRLGHAAAGLVAAVLSWAAASVSVAWVVDALRRSGLWPLV